MSSTKVAFFTSLGKDMIRLVHSFAPSSWDNKTVHMKISDEDKIAVATNADFILLFPGILSGAVLQESKNVKLAWRIDWPMRWAFEKVDFEPGGKDHSSQGGSFDTSKTIVEKIWQRTPPTYLQYDFVSLKGTQGKMSSSSGELITLGEVLQVYEPQIVRWIFENHRPNHDFSI